jgi:hypothetical protein
MVTNTRLLVAAYPDLGLEQRVLYSSVLQLVVLLVNNPPTKHRRTVVEELGLSSRHCGLTCRQRARSP